MSVLTSGAETTDWSDDNNETTDFYAIVYDARPALNKNKDPTGFLHDDGFMRSIHMLRVDVFDNW